MDQAYKFLLIDDEPINNFICKSYIRQLFRESKIVTFEKPLEAFDYIRLEYTEESGEKTILLLDINMPLMSGWDFMNEFAKLDPKITDRFRVYILTSSIDYRDIEKANTNPMIVDIISKPLNDEILKRISSS